jgi:trimethylamine--corrinoid protein Co-methyltransferase
MNFCGQVPSEDEQRRIHHQSLRILAEVGVRFHGQRALPILRRHGAQVDEGNKIVRFPREVVEQALATAPKSFVLGARNPALSFAVPSPVSRYCIDGTAAFAVDFETGERRYGTCRDIQDSLRVFQQADLGVMAWAPTCASDAPAASRALHEFLTMIKYCSKHGQHELHRVEQVPYLVAALQAVAGSEEAIRVNKHYSLIYCTIAPLTHDGQMLDAYLELGEFDMPVMLMPMPVNGTTGPASLASNIALANAEALSAIAIYQLAHPGRPLIYSSATGSLDFRSGGYLAGTAEMGLQSAALTEMGRFYCLPSGAAGCTSDAKMPGPEAVIEKLITTIPAVMAGADIIVGFGEIESDQLLILEQIVVDNEIGHLCQRLRQGVDCAPDKDLLDEIEAVGPGGHFLVQQGTRRAARSGEFYMPRLFDHHTYEAWTELGRPTLYSAAREQVQAILEGPMVDPLPDDVLGELDQILRTADRDLKGASDGA